MKAVATLLHGSSLSEETGTIKMLAPEVSAVEGQRIMLQAVVALHFFVFEKGSL